MSTDIIERAMMQLVHEEPFFANLLLNMTRKIDYNIPTIGVNVTDTVNLYINPHFWGTMNLAEQMDVLKHECYHVIHNHFSRFSELEPQVYEQEKCTIEDRIKNMRTASELNVAGDYAINEYLPNIPKKLKMVDKDGKIMKDENGKPVQGAPCLVKDLTKKAKQENIKVERYQTTEYYYEIMKKLKKEQQQNGDGDSDSGHGMTIDDHSIWADGSQDEGYVTEKVKQVVNKAVEETGGREAGKIPGDVLVAIEALNYKPKDWRSDLRRFVARTSEIFIETSRKKRNRRYGTMYAGTVTYEKLHLCALIDTSASVRDEELNQFGAELYNITKQEVVITVVEFDTEVNNVYRLENGDIMKSASGRGGTAFGPPFAQAKELEVDGIIMFSDMENWDVDAVKKPKVPVLWACLESGSQPHYDWGKRTTVTVNKKK